MSGIRWGLLVLLVLVLVGLIAYARGAEHHHGDDVGALGSRAAATASRVA